MKMYYIIVLQKTIEINFTSSFFTFYVATSNLWMKYEAALYFSWSALD
jgi:hypothetical protein